MNKKLFVVMMSVAFVLFASACGQTATQAEPQPVSETKTSEKAEVVETEEVIPEETETEVLVEETETEVAETETEVDPMEALLESNMGSYISDGVFDFEKFAEDTGSSGWGVSDYSFIIIYNNWYIQAGNNDLNLSDSYVSVGNWEESDTERSNFNTYSYIFPTGSEIKVGDTAVPAECIIHLQDVLSSVKENGGPDVAPSAPGTNFKPCDATDVSTQY